jgi:DNA polymerase-3 subunit beta
MNIESTKERLGEALGKIEKITSKNLTLPVLQCVLLTVTGKELTLRATNLDVGVEVTLPVKVTTEGVVAVPAGILSQYINNIPKEKVVTLKVVDQNLVIVTNQSSTTIKALAHDEFPLIPEAVGEEFTLPSLIIQEGLKSVWYSASTSSIKPELSSVYIYSGDKTIVFVATDSFRLAEKHFPIKEHKELPPFLLPLKNIPDVLKFLDGYTGEVTVSIAKNQITLVFPGHYLTSRVVEGTFPDYKQLIPKSHTTEVILLKQDMLSSLRSVNVFSDKTSAILCSVSVQKKTLQISTKNNDVGEGIERITGSFDGDDVEMTFNYKYLIDCFQSITTESISLAFNGSSRPLIIKESPDRGFTYLVMPMKR